MIRRGGTTSALALGMARASRREGQGCECHPRSVRWVWVWPGVTSANYTAHRESAVQQSEFSLHLSACCATCASVVLLHLVIYRRNVPCHFPSLARCLVSAVRVVRTRCTSAVCSTHYYYASRLKRRPLPSGSPGLVQHDLIAYYYWPSLLRKNSLCAV